MSKYIVRLVMSTDADGGPEAVENFVGQLADFGLRDWTFRVEDAETGEIVGYFNGWGLEVNLDAVEKASQETVITLPDVPDVPVVDESDAGLTRLAESLNGHGPQE